ncbi:ABC transporter substrate-binding protein [Bacillus aquiflavi]|uniref:ABC transporter substrate-binding protein n=1 Tax=Bacillus aquiflavi TaxID=2672567 RepID=A0A6B3VST4_9BACI|nr:ABC transporter substrate-binding protein [Bacillus aquiflavi]MBA4535656.1 ABC transporter substrate-binding protein [Bacillus aquiflavi]NEY80032.1 ABC transporter substrate-binding protein [Bacillus aquiflavi]
MNKSKRFLFTLSIMLIISLFLGACSGAKETDSKKKDSGATGQKELVFGRGGDSTSLDPATTTEGESFKVTENIFEKLINFGEGNTELEEGLALDWEMSEDGLVYTFNLREGVKFHDGTDFNAEAVVYNFERWIKGNTGVSGDDTPFPYFQSQFGDIIKEVKAVEEYKVQFTLNRPQAVFLKNLAMSPFVIASPTALEKHGDKFSEHPVGTGPFKFIEWKRNDKIVIEKFEDYWMEGYPKLDRIIFRSIPENSARLNALKTGEVDLIDGVNFSDVPQIKEDANLQIFSRPSLNVAYLGLTATRGPLTDKKVRQALNYAVDKETLITAFYEGYAQPAKNPMPPVIAGYNDKIEDYPFDLEKAKELLTEAGYPDGFEMELWAMPVPRDYMPDGQKVAEAIKSNFEKIGVKVKIVSYEWGTYLEKAAAGEADSFLLGWTGDNGDADNFLYVLLDEDNIGTNNYTYYKNSELHQILIEAQAEVDEGKREELYQKAQEIIKDDAPWIPLVHSEPVLAGSANITGLTLQPTGSDKLHKAEFK